MMQKNIAERGKIVYLGRGDINTSIDLNNIVTGANTVVGARGHSGYGIYHNIIKMIQKGKLSGIEKIITSIFPFKDILHGFKSSRSRKDAKILIDMDNMANSN